MKSPLNVFRAEQVVEGEEKVGSYFSNIDSQCWSLDMFSLFFGRMTGGVCNIISMCISVTNFYCKIPFFPGQWLKKRCMVDGNCIDMAFIEFNLYYACLWG